MGIDHINKEAASQTNIARGNTSRLGELDVESDLHHSGNGRTISSRPNFLHDQSGSSRYDQSLGPDATDYCLLPPKRVTGARSQRLGPYSIVVILTAQGESATPDFKKSMPAIAKRFGGVNQLCEGRLFVRYG
jgi:hypothetical protein